jgi:CheY-like chemotaxis protein
MTQSPPLILIVDDEPDVLTTYKTKLERSDFRVLTATNGEEGVAAAVANHPDLILMDVKMPVMDGVEAQQKLKDDPTTKDIKVVFLTAFSDPTRPEIDAKFAEENGALDFIKKGIGLDDFVTKIRGYLAS